jgi:hypothetical protein
MLIASMDPRVGSIQTHIEPAVFQDAAACSADIHMVCTSGVPPELVSNMDLVDASTVAEQPQTVDASTVAEQP